MDREEEHERGAHAEGIRLRYLYRALVLRGKVRLSAGSARGLIGPDCAYHLYGRTERKERGRRRSRSRS